MALQLGLCQTGGEEEEEEADESDLRIGADSITVEKEEEAICTYYMKSTGSLQQEEIWQTRNQKFML